jgi:hypothetical protein
MLPPCETGACGIYKLVECIIILHKLACNSTAAAVATTRTVVLVPELAAVKSEVVQTQEVPAVILHEHQAVLAVLSIISWASIRTSATKTSSTKAITKLQAIDERSKISSKISRFRYFVFFSIPVDVFILIFMHLSERMHTVLT